MMSWLPALLGFLAKAGTRLMDWLHDRSVRDAQQTKDQRDQATAGLQEIDEAQAARDAAAADMRRGGVRQPDADTAPRGSDGIS